MATALEAWIIFKSWDFREAYVERYAALYSLSEADKQALRVAQLEAAKTSYEFNIAAQSAVYKWNDLEKRNSPWRISLVDGLGHELLPEFVKLQKLPEAVADPALCVCGRLEHEAVIGELADAQRGEPDPVGGLADGELELGLYA